MIENCDDTEGETVFCLISSAPWQERDDRLAHNLEDRCIQDISQRYQSSIEDVMEGARNNAKDVVETHDASR